MVLLNPEVMLTTVLRTFFCNDLNPAGVILSSRGTGMMRVFHRELMRGQAVQNAAIALFLALLLVLTLSVWHGLGTLAS